MFEKEVKIFVGEREKIEKEINEYLSDKTGDVKVKIKALNGFNPPKFYAYVVW